MPVCAQCGQDNPEVAKFCLACGSPLAAAEPAVIAEERKLITAIFVDLVGSTSRSEQLDPEDVKALVAPYHARVRADLEHHGGTFEKFSGDAVLALFGTPKSHEDDPERAVRAALAVQSSIAELNREDEWLDLHIRIGIHTGEALVMLGARPGEGEWSAAGDVLNTAARIQSAAPTDGILVGKETYLAAGKSFEFREAEPVQAKGKQEPVPVWEVVGSRDTSPVDERDEATLVGRQGELDELAGFCDGALEQRHVGIATIVGPPGIGKSRLLRELVRRLESSCAVHSGRCLSYGEGITYWPVTEIFKSAAGILQSDDRETTAAKLDALLETLDTGDVDEVRTIASALSNLFGIPTTPRGTYSTSEISQGELHWGIRRALQLLSGAQPTAIVVEDLHWAEQTLLELIAYIAADEADAPLVLVCTARPDLEQVAPGFLGADGRRRTVELSTLDHEQSAALLTDLVGEPALAETPFAAALISGAGGNPLFLEETVRMLRERDLLNPERWASDEMRDLPVPTSVQALISSRLDRLAGAEKELAHHGSVVGAVFWAGAVAYLGSTEGREPQDPRQGLAELERRDFVASRAPSTVADDDEYAFKHILMRDVAYGQVPKGRRVELHVRFSDWVSTLPSTAYEFVEIVAWHLEQACLLAREVARSPIEPPIREAAAALADAARRAERRESLREAHRYYARALDVLDDRHDALRVELRLRRADMAMMLGQLKEASDELLEVAENAPLLGRTDVESEALVLLGDIDQRQGRTSQAHQRLTEAQRLASLTEEGSLQIKVAFVFATFLGDIEGRHDDAIESLRAAVATAQEIDDRALVAEGHLRIAALIMSHDLAAAEPELRRCLELASDLGSHRIEAEATSWLGIVAYFRGQPDEGERLCLRARTWFERTGDTYFQVQNIMRGLAIFALSDGRPEEAEVWLREALLVALQIGGWVVVETYWRLVESLVAQDRLDDARELVAFAARSTPEEDPYARSSLLMAEAVVATASGESTAAATAFAEALRLLEGLNVPIDLAEARLALGRSLRALGDVTGGRTELERARAIFSRIGATTRRDAIDRELAELVEGPARPRPAPG
jgi:class 3 adenylate cyclase/tetratricopeptide (TPR) repeat protein/CheY-like chemotaxis protein